jgi:hypothetical protein
VGNCNPPAPSFSPRPFRRDNDDITQQLPSSPPAVGIKEEIVDRTEVSDAFIITIEIKEMKWVILKSYHASFDGIVGPGFRRNFTASSCNNYYRKPTGF